MAGYCFFDTNDLHTFDNLQSWIDLVNTHSTNNPPLILVGTKCDQERMVDEEKICEFARQNKMKHMATSAMTGVNVNSTILHLTKTILRRLSCALFGSIPPRYIPGEEELERFNIVRNINQNQSSTYNKNLWRNKPNERCNVS
eukprot:TRINITY_DN4474_c0_g1_i3.p2 TRINITY_DN4474_c0_g1~~TRINITY_DN4474_c0_g1_i3.p2  ORF type:complete len:143 (-),score=24.36 TRINITY_DN4474_c0_g1_i3:29-457(-)